MESFRDENVGARDDPQLDALLDLVSNFGRVKLSLNSLMLRPTWREKMHQELRAAGLQDEGGQAEDQAGHWLPIFYRLTRRLRSSPSGMNMRLIAEAMGVPVSSATRFVESMVQRGLFERHPDAHDRRLVIVQLTETGSRVFAAMDSNLRDLLGGMLSQFTPQERQQLLVLGSRLFDLWHSSLELVPLPPAKENQPTKPKETP